MYTYKIISFKKNVIAFSWLFLYPYRGYGPKPVKRGCVVHCGTSKNNQKSQKGQFYKWRKQGLLTSFFNGSYQMRYHPIDNSILNKVSVTLYRTSVTLVGIHFQRRLLFNVEWVISTDKVFTFPFFRWASSEQQGQIKVSLLQDRSSPSK